MVMRIHVPPHTWGFVLTAFRSFDGQSLLLVSEDRNTSLYVAER